ncbi:MAG: hypothetical protein ACWGMZ_05690, partial [Thermoguttaceae bacterium]
HPPVIQLGYRALQLASALLVALWCLFQRQRLLNVPMSIGVKTNGHRLMQEASDKLGIDRSEGHLLTLIISIWVSWQLLFGPGSEQLTYGIIAPSAAWAMLVSFSEKKYRLWTTFTWASLALLACGEIEGPLLRIHSGFSMLLPLSVASFVMWLVLNERSPRTSNKT